MKNAAYSAIIVVIAFFPVQIRFNSFYFSFIHREISTICFAPSFVIVVVVVVPDVDEELQTLLP